MTYTVYVRAATGSTVYAKPLPLVTSPWSTGIVAFTENGATGSFAATVDDATEYEVFRQTGGSAAATDSAFWKIDKRAATPADVSVTVNAPSVTVNPTVLSDSSITSIRSGLATSQNVSDAKDDILEGVGEPTYIVTIPAIEAESIVIGAEVTRYRGTEWTIAVENLAAIPAKCYVTIKRGSEPDAKAVCQTLKCNPGVDGDGLQILNGSPTLARSNASIVYQEYTNADDQTRYRAIFTLQAAASAAVIADTYRLDFKDTATDKVLGECVLRVVNPVTLATS